MLTIKEIQNAKPEKKEYLIADGRTGLYMRVLPSGSKSWLYKYIAPSGQRRKMGLGLYPDVSLADARAKHAELRLLLHKGEDPQHRLAPTPSPELLTVSRLAQLWLAEYSAKSHTPKVNYNVTKTLTAGIKGLEDRPADSIRRADAIALLAAVAEKSPAQAENLLKPLRQMYQHAIDNELLESNPFSIRNIYRVIPDMKKTASAGSGRERVLSDTEIKQLWAAIDAGGGSDSTRRALKMMLITGQRNGEVCGMHRREIEHEWGGWWWTIPGDRRKGNKGGTHRVYLTPLALSLIGDRDGYIFPHDYNTAKSIEAHSVSRHVQREIPGTGKQRCYGLGHFTPHDLRRTCATGMRRLGIPRAEMDMILGHVAGGVTGIYDRYEGDAEKEKWLTAWSEHLYSLTNICNEIGRTVPKP